MPCVMCNQDSHGSDLCPSCMETEQRKYEEARLYEEQLMKELQEQGEETMKVSYEQVLKKNRVRDSFVGYIGVLANGNVVMDDHKNFIFDYHTAIERLMEESVAKGELKFGTEVAIICLHGFGNYTVVPKAEMLPQASQASEAQPGVQ